MPTLISAAFPLLFGYYIYRMLKGGGAAGGEYGRIDRELNWNDAAAGKAGGGGLGGMFGGFGQSTARIINKEDIKVAFKASIRYSPDSNRLICTGRRWLRRGED